MNPARLLGGMSAISAEAAPQKYSVVGGASLIILPFSRPVKLLDSFAIYSHPSEIYLGSPNL